MSLKYYDRQGQVIDGVEPWAFKFGDVDYKRVRSTVLSNGKWVSTVWLGMDHRFGDGPPLIFETMVFPSESDFGELDGQRYSTEEGAILGHAEMCAKWEDKVES